MAAARSAPHIDPRSAAALSSAFGIGSGLLIGFVGPIFGGLVVILAFALVFRTADRVAIPWLFVGFAPVWGLLLVVETNATVSGMSAHPLLTTAMGFVPLALSAATVILVRARSSL